MNNFQTYNCIRSFSVVLMLICVGLVNVGCTPQVATRGNLLEEYQIKEILPGIDARDDVVRKIGSPTTVAPFDENKWYYMGQRTEKSGILDPKVTEERILVVSFNPEDGLVDQVAERQGDHEDIPIVQRKTPTSGNDITFIQQMLGNIGKFNRQPGSAANTAGGGL